MEDSYATSRDQADGHKALLELEKQFNKKARAATLSIQGSQIQALTGFIHMFEQYPYPVVINAAILKLADWFRLHNNSVKYYVYKVFKDASDLHLTKVINIEETVRRILPILGSNDPIARSISLRVLGCMSMIIAEKLDVQFAIIQRLELATDRNELEAAIWAGDQICARSNIFPSVIFSKVVDKLQDKQTPFEIKLRLVKIFRHMHQDIGMARQAKLTCLVLLEDPNTDSKLVIVTLRTLTLLLSQAVIDRKEQINRLLDYALNDQREDICYNVLYDLVLLGKNDIMFDETHIIRLLQMITTTKQRRIQQKAMQCAQTLIETHRKLIVRIIKSDVSLAVFMSYVEECERIMHHSIKQQHYTNMITSARLLYSILRIAFAHKVDENAMDVDMPVLSTLTALGHRVAETITQVDLKLIKEEKSITQSNRFRLRELLKIKADFCLLLEDWDCDATFKNTYTLLTDADDDTAGVLLPYLSTISKKCRKLTSWFPQEAIEELQKRINRPSVYVNLIRLLFRTTESNHKITTELVRLLHEFGSWDRGTECYLKNGWNLYLIGKEAGSCQWFELMHLIMKDLRKRVETEASYCWLSALSSLAQAEHSLSKKEASSNLYIQSMLDLKALRSFDQPRFDQIWFIQLRMEFIQAIERTKAIFTANMTSKKLARQMQTSAVMFRKIAFRYDFIAQAQFGIGKEVLNAIESYKLRALICEHAARTLMGSDQVFICVDPSLIPLITEPETAVPHRRVDTTGYLMHQSKQFLRKVTAWEELAHLESDDRRQICGQDLMHILDAILAEPLILPKSFFKNRKNVNIQLTTEPMLSEQKPITLQQDEDLVIKFEGLVQVNPHVKQLEKKIKKAVTVCFVTAEKILHLDDRIGVNMIFSEPAQMLQAENNQSLLIQPPTVYAANVRNSYFTYTGLLSLPKSKTRELLPKTKKEAWVNVFVKILDENSGIWSIGPLQWGKVIW
ncbi:hypothetical protein HMPREF1544_03927 [Mucor circinelloides 1006PhL]|uniref:Integrator complex subunit 7 n=1 Tax=Mucor circinelloides f. circinelloides (strain 1006PhL) TaxID=1220926 RepID=S2JL25_MUCC1|nr:hypothetical protein HMPREF1544_03927 [Mucor circinelloides 1006PhL]